MEYKHRSLNEQGPSKYEFEGPCHGVPGVSPGFPGPPRCVQTVGLISRFRETDSSSTPRSVPCVHPRQHSRASGLTR